MASHRHWKWPTGSTATAALVPLPDDVDLPNSDPPAAPFGHERLAYDISAQWGLPQPHPFPAPAQHGLSPAARQAPARRKSPRKAPATAQASGRSGAGGSEVQQVHNAKESLRVCNSCIILGARPVVRPLAAWAAAIGPWRRLLLLGATTVCAVGGLIICAIACCQPAARIGFTGRLAPPANAFPASPKALSAALQARCPVAAVAGAAMAHTCSALATSNKAGSRTTVKMSESLATPLGTCGSAMGPSSGPGSVNTSSSGASSLKAYACAIGARLANAVAWVAGVLRSAVPRWMIKADSLQACLCGTVSSADAAALTEAGLLRGEAMSKEAAAMLALPRSRVVAQGHNRDTTSVARGTAQ
jgi:hypothetical protein